MNMMTLLSLFTHFTLSMGKLNIDDSCISSSNGICDEPFYEGGCNLGTDYTDCHANRGPNYLYDIKEEYCLSCWMVDSCRENMYLVYYRTQEQARLNRSDTNVNDEICEEFLLEYKTMIDTPPIEEEEEKNCSGVLQCGIIDKNREIKKEAKDQFLSSLFFQGIFVYCSCIYYRRILDGFRFIRDNIDIIFRIWCIIMKCIAYLFLLALTIGIVITAMGDTEKQEPVLKILGFVSFLDYIDGRMGEREGEEVEEDEEEAYQRWRRRRDRYN